MADRRVSVRLEADVNDYTAKLAKAAAATRELGNAGRDASTSAGKGFDDAGRSAQGMGDKVTDSTRKVGLSADQAARQIASVRAELEELSRSKVGVGIDTADARVELDRLRAELDEVASSDPEARVKADTAAAKAQLRAIESQLNRIDGQTVNATVNVNTRNTGGGIGGSLGSLGAALSPALLPLGAVGLAGGLGAGAAGTAVLPVLGAAALGYSNVADAVKLLNNQQLQSTLDGQKSAVQAATTAAAQASAARQVQSATQGEARARSAAAWSIASAQSQASSSVQSALHQQQQAEKSLAAAQQDERHAQEDLTAARKTAQQQIEDTTSSLEDNALSQRQAVLDIADARKELEAAQGSGDADRIARATLALDQQLQRQKELVVQGKRLQDQQDENTRTGVDGSAVVVAAQRRVADATAKVADAQQSAGDAAAAVDKARVDGAAQVAHAQQEGAQRIADAQEQVIAAQQAAALAAVKAGDDTSGSMARIQAQLDQLSPATVAFASYVTSKLAPAFQSLQQANAGELLPRTQQALDILLTRMPEVTRFTTGLSAELGDLEVDAARALTGPFWSQFFNDIESRGVPLLDSFGHSAGNIATGAAGIVQAFLPIGTDVADGIERASSKFSAWGQQLQDSDEFHEFTSYVEENWPKIEQIIGNVGGVIERLVEAGMPIGSAYLLGFQLLSKVLSDLPVPVVEALLVALTAYKGAQGVVGTIDGIANSYGKLSKQIEGLPDKVSKTNLALGTIGAVATTATISSVASDIGKVANAGDDAKETIASLRQAINDADNDQDKFARTNAALDALKSKASEGQRVLDSYDKQGWFNKYIWQNPFDGNGDYIDAKKSVEQYKDAIDKLTPAQQQMAKSMQDTGSAASVADPQVDAYRTQLQKASDAAGVAKSSTDLFKTSLDLLTGSNVSTVQAEAAFYDAVDQAKTATDNLSGSVLDASGQLDVHSAAGRAAADTLIGLKDRANDVISTMITQGATSDQVAAKDAELRDSFIHTAEQMGISQDAASRLADQILGIPDQRNTQITADTTQATDAARALQDQINSLQGRQLTISLNTMEIAPGVYQQAYQTANGGRALGVKYQATGGPVIGPGGPTEDRAGLYALSNGEHVWSAREVAAAGGHSAMEALRSQVLAAGGGRANGGPIGVSLGLDMNPALQGMADLAAEYVGSLLGGGGGGSSANVPTGSGVERWRGLVLQALQMVGQPANLVDETLRRMNQESGGNPRAINLWDSNAKKGTPSKGLMQVIDPTFRANAYPGYSSDIYDPLSNILASMEYALRRYGSLASAYNRAGGYANGGTTPANSPFWVGENGPELMWSDREQFVSTAAQSREVSGAAGGGGATTVQAGDTVVKVYIDGQEFHGIARVEATSVVDSKLNDYRRALRT